MISNYFVGGNQIKKLISICITLILSLCLLPGNAFADELNNNETNIEDEQNNEIDYDNLDVEPKDMQDPSFQQSLDEMLEGVDKEQYKEEYYPVLGEDLRSMIEDSDDLDGLMYINNTYTIDGEDEEQNIVLYDGYNITDMPMPADIDLTVNGTYTSDIKSYTHLSTFSIVIYPDATCFVVEAKNLTTKHNGWFDTYEFPSSYTWQQLSGGYRSLVYTNRAVKFNNNYGILTTAGISSFNQTINVSNMHSKMNEFDVDATNGNNNGLAGEGGNVQAGNYNLKSVKKWYFNPLTTRKSQTNGAVQEYNCKTLYNQTINASATNQNNLFDGCTSLQSISHLSALSGLKNNTNGSYMFRNCTSLTSLDNIEFTQYASRLVNTTAMFQGCTGLTNVNITTAMSNNTNLSYMFNGCTNLNTLSLTGATNANSNQSYMFNNCSKLSTLNISGLNNTSASTNMFNGCIRLKQVTFNKNYRFRSDGLLPSISETYVTNATGMWYDNPGINATEEWSPSELMTQYNSRYATIANTWYSYNEFGGLGVEGEMYLDENGDIVTALYNPNRDPNHETPVVNNKLTVSYLIDNNKNMNDDSTQLDNIIVDENGLYKLNIKSHSKTIPMNLNKRNQYFIQAVIAERDEIVDTMCFEFDPTFTLSAPISFNAGWMNTDGTVDINKKSFYSYVNTSYANETDDSASFDYWSQFKPTDMQLKYNNENINLVDILDQNGNTILPVRMTYTNKSMQRINFSTTAASLADFLADYKFEDGDLVEEIGSVQYYVDNVKPLRFIEA